MLQGFERHAFRAMHRSFVSGGSSARLETGLRDWWDVSDVRLTTQ